MDAGSLLPRSLGLRRTRPCHGPKSQTSEHPQGHDDAQPTAVGRRSGGEESDQAAEPSAEDDEDDFDEEEDFPESEEPGEAGTDEEEPLRESVR